LHASLTPDEWKRRVRHVQSRQQRPGFSARVTSVRFSPTAARARSVFETTDAVNPFPGRDPRRGADAGLPGSRHNSPAARDRLSAAQTTSKSRSRVAPHSATWASTTAAGAPLVVNRRRAYSLEIRWNGGAFPIVAPIFPRL
jgi:hypothetical protein